MIRDVFYFGNKPNVHPREKFAKNLDDAKSQATTDHFWIINEFCDYTNFDWDFDFYFLPDEDMWAEDHINIWPSQHQKDSGTWLVNTTTLTPYKVYRNDVGIVKRKNIKVDNWVINEKIDEANFDFSWHPDPTEPPFIYKWGCKYYPVETKAVLEYHVLNATQVKYMTNNIELLPEKDKWVIIQEIEPQTFDFSWRPDPREPAYIHVWGNKNIDGKLKPTLEYHALGATQIKYMTNDLIVMPEWDRWVIPKNISVENFDFSWRPNPTSPPYIYQFGTLIDRNDGPKYITPNNNNEIVYLQRIEKNKDIEIKRYYIETTLDDLVNKHPDEVFWALRPNIDYTSFDFNWRPVIINNAYEFDYVHVFGSSESVMTQTYFVSGKHYLKGSREFKFAQNLEITSANLIKIFEKPEMFFIDKGNEESEQRFIELKKKFPNIQKTRFLNSWVDTINRCCNKAKTQLFWVLNSELDYSNFDFDYYPNPWQFKMVTVFGTQWGQWGTTFMVNKESFPNDTKYIKIIEHLSNLNFIKDRKAIATNILYDTVLINHGNIDDESIKMYKFKLVVDYKKDYLTTFKEIIKLLPEKKDHFVWITSSVCDYNSFDFTYMINPFNRDQIHVFPSDKQKFGDTFLINVNELRNKINDMVVLESYGKINYNNHQVAKRLEAPKIITENDTHVESINTEFNFPYAIFVTKENADLNIDDEPMNLWSEETKNIQVTSTGGTRIVVPKEARNHVKTQLYDYPYIKKSNYLLRSKPLDIVYLSNGEKYADENFEHLLNVTTGLENKIKRVDGVNGRVNAYHAAANASDTPWMFTVFAKLKVDSKFNWNWQPDRLQMPKHYMFNAKNPLNGLIYGHQGIIAYNKKLTLNNMGLGLDFTLDDPHDSVDMLSGIAYFNIDPFITWRTAFREVIKLSNDTSSISKERLDTWLNKAEGDFAEYCLYGAKDGLEYYDIVNGDFDKLKLSYEWAWLSEYFKEKYVKL